MSLGGYGGDGEGVAFRCGCQSSMLTAATVVSGEKPRMMTILNQVTQLPATEVACRVGAIPRYMV
jgi:hypothetical protein